MVIVSCVDDKAPYRNHPNELVGKNCRHGYCRLQFDSNWEAELKNVGTSLIQNQDVLRTSLAKRTELRIDPYSQGYDELNLDSYDLQSFRLCFQVFIPTESSHMKLDSVISEVIKSKSIKTRMEILKLSSNTSNIEGGQEIMMFCSNFAKNDVEIHFAHTNTLGQIETMKAKVDHENVIPNSGIIFKTPEFFDKFITGRIQTYLYLYKPSTDEKSPYWPFYYEHTSTKLHSGKFRHNPYQRKRTLSKNSTAKITEVEKVIAKLKANFISDEDGVSMTDLILAASSQELHTLRHSDIYDTKLDVNMDYEEDFESEETKVIIVNPNRKSNLEDSSSINSAILNDSTELPTFQSDDSLDKLKITDLPTMPMNAEAILRVI